MAMITIIEDILIIVISFLISNNSIEFKNSDNTTPYTTNIEIIDSELDMITLSFFSPNINLINISLFSLKHSINVNNAGSIMKRILIKTKSFSCVSIFFSRGIAALYNSLLVE